MLGEMLKFFAPPGLLGPLVRGASSGEVWVRLFFFSEPLILPPRPELRGVAIDRALLVSTSEGMSLLRFSDCASSFWTRKFSSRGCAAKVARNLLQL